MRDFCPFGEPYLKGSFHRKHLASTWTNGHRVYVTIPSTDRAGFRMNTLYPA
jgi:hypothetical protein